MYCYLGYTTFYFCRESPQWEISRSCLIAGETTGLSLQDINTAIITTHFAWAPSTVCKYDSSIVSKLQQSCSVTVLQKPKLNMIKCNSLFIILYFYLLFLFDLIHYQSILVNTMNLIKFDLCSYAGYIKHNNWNSTLYLVCNWALGEVYRLHPLKKKIIVTAKRSCFMSTFNGKTDLGKLIEWKL